MDIALLQQIVSYVFQIIPLIEKYGPDIIKDLENAYNILISGNPITAEQQTQIDAALDSAHNLLQSDAAAKDVAGA